MKKIVLFVLGAGGLMAQIFGGAAGKIRVVTSDPTGTACSAGEVRSYNGGLYGCNGSLVFTAVTGAQGPAGPTGPQGEVVSVAGTYSDGQSVVANGTTGDSLKPLTLTATVVKMTSGVPSAAVAGTDYEAPLTFTAPLNRSANAVSCVTASGSVAGCLSAADWTSFNAKYGSGANAAFNSMTVTASGAGAPVIGRTHASTVLTDPFFGVQNGSNVWLGGFLGNGKYNNPGQTSGAAVFDFQGTLVKATGNAGDCVKVDGSTGPCGEGGASFSFASLQEAQEGLNTTKVMSPALVVETISAYVEGGDGVVCSPIPGAVECGVDGTVVRVLAGTVVPGSCTDTKQLFIKTNAASGQKLYYCNGTAYEAVVTPATVAWGGITGTLSNQTDLQTALNTLTTAVSGKQDASTALNDWAAKARPTGMVVGTTDVQTLTNKSISGGQITSAVGTATALAANGTNCGVGQAAQGVDAQGNAEGCFTPAGGGGGTGVANATNIVASGTSVTVTHNADLANVYGFTFACIDEDDGQMVSPSGMTSVTGNAVTFTFTGTVTNVRCTVNTSGISATATRTQSMAVFSPVVEDSGRVQVVLPAASTITRVWCNTKAATNVVINLEERAEGTPDTAGTVVLTSNLTCTTSGAATTTFSNASIAARAPIALTLASVSGTPDTLRVHFEYTVD